MVEFHKVLELGPRKTAFSLSLFGITQYPGGPCLCTHSHLFLFRDPFLCSRLWIHAPRWRP